MKNRWVVVDKDFLQADADKSGLNKIIDSEFRLLLTARTAYEIQTTEEQVVRNKCLQILDAFRDNVDVVDEDGNNGLLGYEIKNKKPSSDVLQNYIHSLPHNLDQFLQNIGPSQWSEYFEKGPAEEFGNVVSEMKNKIPSLNKNDLKDRNKVQGYYAKLTGQSRELPSAEYIDERWIIFRRLQVDCWMILDRAHVNDENRLHDRIDSRVADVALLTKGLATNDRLIKNIFSFFCSTGKLFSKTN